MQSLVLQLVLHPEIQTRAQEELDSVIGSPNSSNFRLPSFDDRPQLPYIEALCKEILRWRPPAATGFPRASMADDIYRQWRIKKETIIVPNAWGMLRDEEIYKDPETFRPERFLGTSPEPDPALNGAFGFGRRYAIGS